MTDIREKKLNQIRGLLSKTTERGCTLEEELSALATARAMIDAYAISDEELQLTKEERAILRAEPKGSSDPHKIKSHLAYAVAKFTDCECWRNNKEEGGGLVFCGLPSDCRYATWMLDHLTTFVQGELAKYLMGPANVKTGADRRRVIQGFVDGVTSSISKRLIKLCEPSAPTKNANSRALVVTKKALIQARLDELGIKLRSCNGSGRQHDADALNAGRAAGNGASFGRPVSGQAGALRLK
jgi:hypothetical protein